MSRQAILIMCDTQRPDMLGCYGNPNMHTPNIDRLASQGVRFDRAYTCQPVCGPARSAIFTGLYPHTNSSFTNCVALGANVKTVGQRLSLEGVPCAYVGKWHLDGGDYFGLGKCPEGWDADYWYDMKCFLESMSQDDRRRSRDWRTPVNAEDTYAYQCATRAIDYIRRHADGDFFLTLSFDEPHDPMLCPEPFASMYKGFKWKVGASWNQDISTLPAHIRAWSGGSAASEYASGEGLSKFLGCNSFVDDQTGRVLDAIDRLCPNALVMYTSDHGDAMGAHRIWNKGPAIYDEVTRIPLIARMPGAPKGAVNAHPASHIDITPTLLEHFGCERATWCEGESMLPAILSQNAGRERAFYEFMRYEVDHDGFGGFQPFRCVTDGRYKLGVHLLSDDEFFDLQNDPSETRNLIADTAYTSVRNALHDALLDWMNDTRDPFRGYYWERRPWRTDARPATWDYTLMTRQREHEPFEPRQLDYSTGLPMQSATRKKGP